MVVTTVVRFVSHHHCIVGRGIVSKSIASKSAINSANRNVKEILNVLVWKPGFKVCARYGNIC